LYKWIHSPKNQRIIYEIIEITEITEIIEIIEIIRTFIYCRSLKARNYITNHPLLTKRVNHP